MGQVYRARRERRLAGSRQFRHGEEVARWADRQIAQKIGATGAKRKRETISRIEVRPLTNKTLNQGSNPCKLQQKLLLCIALMGGSLSGNGQMLPLWMIAINPSLTQRERMALDAMGQESPTGSSVIPKVQIDPRPGVARLAG